MGKFYPMTGCVLILTMSAREIIVQKKKLDDLVINILLKRQFPSTLLLTTLPPFGGWQENYLQICHCQARVTVSTKGAGEIFIYDSFYNDVHPATASIFERLFNSLFNSHKMAIVSEQVGGVDCGVLNATAIALGDSVTQLPKFDQDKIRPCPVWRRTF